MGPRSLSRVGTLLLCAALAGLAPAQETSQAAPANQPETRTVLKTTVRRVVLDVTVTDSKGTPVPGLTRDDFRVTEDGQPQKILSFDANGFTPEMDYTPPALPKQPAGTYINLPSAPERGPLYVLLYDMVNMDDPSQTDTPEDHHIQMIARQQMVKFIASKPEGARIAIFAWSDGLHLVQGFTSDKAELLAAVDPHHPRPHMPAIFLMGANFGRGNRLSAMDVLQRIALYLDGMPGRKNLIWFSGEFPLSLFADNTDGPNFREETKATLDLLAHDQVAVYPVDARGVALQDSHTATGTSVHNAETSGTQGVGGGAAQAQAGNGTPSSAGAAAGAVQGDSAVVGSFNVMDGIARETGGRAFYGTNDLAKELVTATQSGGVYYTLTYAPANTEFSGNLRNIHVELVKKGYQLAYRRSYYGTTVPEETAGGVVPVATAGGTKMPTAQRQVGDSLSANMEHGAPIAHALVFVVQAHATGEPVQGTPAQMAELATEPAYFKSRRKNAVQKPLAPVPLQNDVFSFEIPTRQFKGEAALDLELAIAAYDADGRMMNGIVRVAQKDLDGKTEVTKDGEAPRFFRVEQELEVPMGAATVRVGVRDTTNDRTGAMEIALPFEGKNTAKTAAASGSR